MVIRYSRVVFKYHVVITLVVSFAFFYHRIRHTFYANVNFVGKESKTSDEFLLPHLQVKLSSLDPSK